MLHLINIRNPVYLKRVRGVSQSCTPTLPVRADSYLSNPLQYSLPSHLLRQTFPLQHGHRNRYLRVALHGYLLVQLPRGERHQWYLHSLALDACLQVLLFSGRWHHDATGAHVQPGLWDNARPWLVPWMDHLLWRCSYTCWIICLGHVWGRGSSQGGRMRDHW